jgi:hypothetical protein
MRPSRTLGLIFLSAATLHIRAEGWLRYAPVTNTANYATLPVSGAIAGLICDKRKGIALITLVLWVPLAITS